MSNHVTVTRQHSFRWGCDCACGAWLATYSSTESEPRRVASFRGDHAHCAEGVPDSESAGATCPGCTEDHLTDQHAPGDPVPEAAWDQQGYAVAWDQGYAAAHRDERESMPDHTKNPYRHE